MPGYFFTYGTLKAGGLNHYQLAGCKFIGSGVAANTLLVDLGPFPGLVFARIDKAHWARGEVYRLDAPYRLKLLDRLEQEGTLYKRVVSLVAVEGRMLPCWMYTYLITLNPDHAIPGGTWSL